MQPGYGGPEAGYGAQQPMPMGDYRGSGGGYGPGYGQGPVDGGFGKGTGYGGGVRGVENDTAPPPEYGAGQYDAVSRTT